MTQVRNDPDKRRFEMDIEGAGVAFANYRLTSEKVYAVTHTETPRAVRGQGLGDQLVKGMLDLIRAEGGKVVPMCSFVAAYVRRHPEYQDLLER